MNIFMGFTFVLMMYGGQIITDFLPHRTYIPIYESNTTTNKHVLETLPINTISSQTIVVWEMDKNSLHHLKAYFSCLGISRDKFVEDGLLETCSVLNIYEVRHFGIPTYVDGVYLINEEYLK
jgi:hypothetical protein